MTQLFTNNAATLLASGITNTATSLTVATGDGAKFPALGGGDTFLATLFQVVNAAEVNHEIVNVTARSGDTFTIVRAQEGTTGRAFSTGDRVELRVTAGTLNGLAANVTHGAATKATPVDADELPLTDSAASFALKNLTWANLKAAVRTYLLGIVNTWAVAQIGAVTALTSTTNSIAINLALSNHFSHTLTENTTLANPTNAVAGQSGQITFTQHASAAKTLAFGSQWIYAGSGTNPALSTTTSAVNLMSYYVVDSTHIWFGFSQHGVA